MAKAPEGLCDDTRPYIKGNKHVETLMTRHDQFVAALWQHIQLTVAALVIAALIAIPLAIWAENHRRYAEWLLQLTGLFFKPCPH